MDKTLIFLIIFIFFLKITQTYAQSCNSFSYHTFNFDEEPRGGSRTTNGLLNAAGPNFDGVVANNSIRITWNGISRVSLITGDADDIFLGRHSQPCEDLGSIFSCPDDITFMPQIVNFPATFGYSYSDPSSTDRHFNFNWNNIPNSCPFGLVQIAYSIVVYNGGCQSNGQFDGQCHQYTLYDTNGGLYRSLNTSLSFLPVAPTFSTGVAGDRIVLQANAAAFEIIGTNFPLVYSIPPPYIGSLDIESLRPANTVFILDNLEWWCCEGLEVSTLESPSTPSGTNSNAECGNGIRETGEFCDDNNLTDEDGCSSLCIIENGYNCQENNGGMSECSLDSSKSNNLISIVSAVVAGLCCIIFIVVGVFSFFIWRFAKKNNSEIQEQSIVQEKGHINGTSIDMSKRITGVNIEKMIGKGNFGNIYKGNWNETDVALKSIKSANPKELDEELGILTKLSHPHVLRSYGYFLNEEDEMFIVLEYMNLGDALSFLHNSLNVQTETCIKMAHHAAKGMHYLHEENIIHRDLACRNLLMCGTNDNITLKISDFGLSRETENYYIASNTTIPIRWTSPESIKTQKFTKASDVYSYSIVLWEIFSKGEVPYSGISNKQVIEEIDQGHRPSIPKTTPLFIADLMKECWDQNASKRPVFKEILSVFTKILTGQDSSEDIIEKNYEKIEHSTVPEAKPYGFTPSASESSSLSNNYNNQGKPETTYNNYNNQGESETTYNNCNNQGESETTYNN